MSAPIWPLLGGEPVRSALSGGQVIPEASPDHGFCPRCGTNRLTRPNATRCEACAVTVPMGTLSAAEPSHRLPQHSAATERTFREGLATCERATAAVDEASQRIEQSWRD